MRFDVKAFALTCGLIWGLGLLLITWWVILWDGPNHDVTLIGRLYRGHDLFAELRIWRAEHRHVTNEGRAHQHGLDLGGKNVGAAGNEHILFALNDIKLTVSIHAGQITGMEPAAGKGGLRALLIAEVAEQ